VPSRSVRQRCRSKLRAGRALLPSAPGPGRRGASGQNCESRRPRAAIFSWRSRLPTGYTLLMPVPMTAKVRPPSASAARCAAVSIPRPARQLPTRPAPRGREPRRQRWPGRDQRPRAIPRRHRGVVCDQGSADEQNRRHLVDPAKSDGIVIIEDGYEPAALGGPAIYLLPGRLNGSGAPGGSISVAGTSRCHTSRTLPAASTSAAISGQRNPSGRA
jgi:hypothetical protein